MLIVVAIIVVTKQYQHSKMKDVTCLTQTIGLVTQCETIEGTSGYRINDLRGVSLKFGDKIASTDYINGKEYLLKTLEHAARVVSDETMTYFSKYFNYDAVRDSSCFGYNGLTYEALGTGVRGIKINKRYASSYKIKITHVTLTAESDVTDYVLTLTDGGYVKTYTFNLVAHQETTVLINYVALTESVTITGDQSAVRLLGSSTKTGCGGCGTAGYSNQTRWLEVHGIDEGGDLHDDKLFGILPCVVLSCNDANAWCPVADQLALALLYKTGGMLYRDLAESTRINQYTWYKKEDARKEAMYYDNADTGSFKTGRGLYQQQMVVVTKNLFNFFAQSKDDCFRCSQIMGGYATP